MISNFAPLHLRDDVGALWENFVIMERRKALAYARRESIAHFWRTYQQNEVDLIEDRDGQLRAFECKWNPKAKVKRPTQFLNAYSGATFEVITPDNLLQNLGNAAR